jgi:hypothetical protein
VKGGTKMYLFIEYIGLALRAGILFYSVVNQQERLVLDDASWAGLKKLRLTGINGWE